MATLPPVAGLLKHQLYFLLPTTTREQDVVMTLWTWKNEDPVAGARVTYEQGAIKTWVQSAGFRAQLTNQSQGTWLKSWDMGSTPPSRFAPLNLWPRLSGSYAGDFAPQVSALIALRTQPVGSSIRNRLNGRVYHPFTRFDQVDFGNIDSSSRATLVTLYHALRDVLKPAANAASGTWVVPSFFTGGALRVGGPLLPAVDHVICRTQLAIQRRRLHRPGPYAVGS